MMMTAGRLNWESGFGIWALVAFFFKSAIIGTKSNIVAKAKRQRVDEKVMRNNPRSPEAEAKEFPCCDWVPQNSFDKKNGRSYACTYVHGDAAQRNAKILKNEKKKNLNQKFNLWHLAFISSVFRIRWVTDNAAITILNDLVLDRSRRQK
jgi:hypothetical protein